MLCQVCGKRKATFHFEEVINAEERELHLCEVCAKEKGLSESFFIPSFLLSNLMAGLTELELPFSEEVMARCPHCGLDYAQIRKKGKIGCSLCYQTFKDYLAVLLEKIQGKVYHSGKVPKKGKLEDKKQRQIYKLRKDLEEAIRKEEYEKAAQLRDEIRALETIRNTHHAIRDTSKGNDSSGNG